MSNDDVGGLEQSRETVGCRGCGLSFVITSKALREHPDPFRWKCELCQAAANPAMGETARQRVARVVRIVDPPEPPSDGTCPECLGRIRRLEQQEGRPVGLLCPGAEPRTLPRGRWARCPCSGCETWTFLGVGETGSYAVAEVNRRISTGPLEECGHGSYSRTGSYCFLCSGDK